MIRNDFFLLLESLSEAFNECPSTKSEFHEYNSLLAIIKSYIVSSLKMFYLGVLYLVANQLNGPV